MTPIQIKNLKIGDYVKLRTFEDLEEQFGVVYEEDENGCQVALRIKTPDKITAELFSKLGAVVKIDYLDGSSFSMLPSGLSITKWAIDDISTEEEYKEYWTNFTHIADIDEEESIYLIKEYDLLYIEQDDDIKDLLALVDEAINNGWQPQGGASSFGKYLLQAMVKYE